MRHMKNSATSMSIPVCSRYLTRASLLSNHSQKSLWAHRSYGSKAVIEENDIVLLLKKRDPSSSPILTKSLSDTGKEKWEIGRRTDSIPQSEIIGKKIRDVVRSKRGEEYRIHKPTLGEYVALCPRIVTPIYPADANLIVSLLDLNLPQYDEESPDTIPFEIFEAGTGHGGLTLHLARAIHGANPPISKEAKALEETIDVEEGNCPNPSETFSPLMTKVLGDSYLNVPRKGPYASKRRAIIQTLDTSTTHSNFAKKVIKNYRNGMYYQNIDFHVGTIESYLSSRLQESGQPFLEHVILDLPSTHNFLEIVAKALKPNGMFIAFCPSITQITSCVLKAKNDKLPFWLETVLEIGPGAGTGGRLWDVRAIKPRAVIKAELEAAKRLKESKNQETESVDQEHEAQAVNVLGIEKESSEAEQQKEWIQQEKLEDMGEDSGWEMICRPKVGDKVVGGGFIAVWRCMEM